FSSPRTLSICLCFTLLPFFFNAPAPTEFSTLSLHDALPISVLEDLRAAEAPEEGGFHRRGEPRSSRSFTSARSTRLAGVGTPRPDRKSTRLNSSHVSISYAVFCLKKKTKNEIQTLTTNVNQA